MNKWTKAAIIAMTGMAFGLSGALASALAAPEGGLADSPKTGTTTGLICTWVAFESQKETFVVDAGNSSLYWVNQNQLMKIRQFNSGRLVAEGTRNRLKVNAEKFEEKVPVRMVFDRISGDFLVLQDAYKIEALGTCQTRRIF
jgi:hypothetical protein